MNTVREKILQTVENNGEDLFSLACKIFDHPELGLEEYFASNLLVEYLEEKGFSVERGVGGLETAFRATWEQGSGGPSIGFMMEYDALRDMGHGCGHHLQSSTCIGAALALREACKESFKLVLYGTPDEERRGGKINMVDAGCFRDVDVIFSYHTSSKTCVSRTSKALAPHRVTFHGTSAHAAAAPWNGRSALDAAMLAFHGLEIMREHIKDGCRVHYSILEGTGPANIVHNTVKTHITLRANERQYLEDMKKRMKNVIKGACMMTETTYDIEHLPVYWNIISIPSLRKTALAIADEIGAEKVTDEIDLQYGSTDVGNVSWVTPNLNLKVYYGDCGEHTMEYVNNGKTEKARVSMLNGSKIFALTALKLIKNPDFMAEVKAEHRMAISNN